MDENQLKYKRVFNLTDEEVKYKKYLLTFDFGHYEKKITMRACCYQEIHDSIDTTTKRLIDIKVLD